VNWRRRKELDKKLLKKLLRKSNEQDWLGFKGKLKLYHADGKVAEQARDEFIKDILGLANGNSHTIRRTKYLIVGADNIQFTENAERVLLDVDYKVPTQSEIAIWLKNACTPGVVGVECELVIYMKTRLFVVVIPPTFDLHETIRDLITPNGKFHKHTVFMRQDEHVIPASVRDGITIQQLKHLFRQEIANPSALWLGLIVGGIVGFIISQAKIRAAQIALPMSENVLLATLTVSGIFFGGSIGWIIKRFNETRYDWRYMTWWERMLLIIVTIILLVGAYYTSLK